MAARHMHGVPGQSNIRNSNSSGNKDNSGACAPPIMHPGIKRSGAGMPWRRPAVDGPCGCGWGSTLMRGSWLWRKLGVGSRGRDANTCGCATAVVSRASVSCTPTLGTLAAIQVPPRDGMARTVHIMLEAVEPAGPWRVFIDNGDSTTMFGPYTDATPAITILAGTIKALRSVKMETRVDGDVEHLLETFRACGADLPAWAVSVVRGS